MKTQITLNGTEKQIDYANDLISKQNDRIERMEAKGREERVSFEKAFLGELKDGDSAGNVITILNNFSFFKMGNENHGMTWRNAIENGMNAKPNK